MGGRTVAVLCGAVSRTRSILLAAFLCNCRQVFFSIRFVSVHVVHPYSSTDITAAWKKLHFVLSVRSDFHTTDSLSIAVHAFASRVSMSVSLMRHCSLGRWTCQLVSERNRLEWRYHLFDWSTFILSCVLWHGGRCLQRLVPDYVAEFRLLWGHLPEVLYHRRSQSL